MFAGMVLVSKGGGKGGGRHGVSDGGGPGLLPRYGQLGGQHYMIADAALEEIQDIGKGKAKVRWSALLIFACVRTSSSLPFCLCLSCLCFSLPVRVLSYV